MKNIKAKFIKSNCLLSFLSVFVCGLVFSAPVYGGEMSAEEIKRRFEALERRIRLLEEKVAEKDKIIEDMKKEKSEQGKKMEGQDKKATKPNNSEKQEESDTKGPLEKWYEKVQLSGVAEVEYKSEKRRLRDPGYDYSSSCEHNDDITLATAQLGADVQINKYVAGHIIFLWEEDEENEHLFIDEATIKLGGIDETYGFYLLGGRYYPHFGQLNSFLVSGPLTEEIFELNETAAEIGYSSDWFSACAGVFHGDIEVHEKARSRIQGFFSDANFHNPKDTLGGVSILAGASYLRNVADSDTLQDKVVDSNADGDLNDINNFSDGIALYLVAEYWKFAFGAEYITALDYFGLGKMAYAVDRDGIPMKTRPAAWNFELAFRPIESLQFALRYEGSRDLFGLFPAHQYGGSVSWQFLKYTTISGEYLRGKYNGNNQNEVGMVEDRVDSFTVQLAIEFP